MAIKEHVITVTAKHLGVALSTSDASVLIYVDDPEHHLGLAPNVGLALRLSADEARGIAGALLRKADAAAACAGTESGTLVIQGPTSSQ